MNFHGYAEYKLFEKVITISRLAKEKKTFMCGGVTVIFGVSGPLGLL
jgi:hypothetical protein